jgi:hypothetical protein
MAYKPRTICYKHRKAGFQTDNVLEKWLCAEDEEEAVRKIISMVVKAVN